jgi:molybdate transport system substrate-binding protein
VTRSAAAIVLVALALGGGCGGDEGGDRLVVSAAASLKEPFSAYGAEWDGAQVRLSFAGSDELAAQIRQGARPDVYAAANTALPEALHREGLVERPRVFAANRLVLAVPRDGGRVGSLADAGREGVRLAVGSRSVPIGSYTREAIARLGEERSRRILANVRSEEPDVRGIVGKLTQGAVDAGFLYVTDVAAAGGGLRAIELPAELRPEVAYAVAVVEGSDEREAARAFVDGLVDGAGARRLREAGFQPPPP